MREEGEKLGSWNISREDIEGRYYCYCKSLYLNCFD